MSQPPGEPYPKSGALVLTGTSESCASREPYHGQLQAHCWHVKESTAGKSQTCCYCGKVESVPNGIYAPKHGPFAVVVAAFLSCLLLCGCPLPDDAGPYDPDDPNPVEAASTKERVRAAQVRNAHEKARRMRLLVAEMEAGTIKTTSEFLTRWNRDVDEAGEAHALSFQKALEAAAPSAKGITPSFINACLRAAEGLEAVR